MALFFDTSALAKLYHEEVGSAVVRHLVEIPDQVSFISRLGVLEMHSALAGKLRTGEITAEAMELARRRFRGDIRERRFRVVALRATHYELAEELLTAHGTGGLRTLDALQLALALDLHRNHLIGSMVAVDRILVRVAPLEGLTVSNPETAVT
jgi:predicted nucleic acid-binding protein